ncbi:hypothetical protein ABZ260_12145, partial [Streptosporangium sp. NPDC006013]|uniref:hypothetical protein n=1 Tax=Streptosporangium sp. NPDC006013 TaxID=3155596 RepID=UPI0033AC7A90
PLAELPQCLLDAGRPAVRAAAPTGFSGPTEEPGRQVWPGEPQARVRPHPYPSETPGPRPAVSGDDGDGTATLSALPDLSLTAPRQGFSNPETRR